VRWDCGKEHGGRVVFMQVPAAPSKERLITLEQVVEDGTRILAGATPPERSARKQDQGADQEGNGRLSFDFCAEDGEEFG
jgi:hypothetical protein